MPNQKQRRTRVRREPPPPPPPPAMSMLECLIREMATHFRPPSRSQQHLKNAAIELLEAMRALLDECIDRLREERGDSELRRIRVEE